MYPVFEYSDRHRFSTQKPLTKLDSHPIQLIVLSCGFNTLHYQMHAHFGGQRYSVANGCNVPAGTIDKSGEFFSQFDFTERYLAKAQE